MPGKKKKINNREPYEALRKKGTTKGKAARTSHTENPDYDSRPYEERTRSELYEIAKALQIPGRSKMDKDQLITAIRKS